MSEKEKLSRRKLLRSLGEIAGRTACISVALATSHAWLALSRSDTGSRAYPASPEALLPVDSSLRIDGVIRPPGAVEEKTFLAGCIRCYRCQDACEPGAIRFFTGTDGKYYHTPYIDPSVRACTLCMKCTRICPSGALIPTDVKDRSSVKMASVEFREDLCLSHKAKRIRDEQALLARLGRKHAESQDASERRGPCGECYMVCPLRGRAIKLEPGAFLAPLVFPENCAGCGLCEEICRIIVGGDPAIRVVPTRLKV